MQDADSAARQRFQSFKMGGGAPPQSLLSFASHSHHRSRSRNSSVSSFSLPPPDSPSSSLPPPTRPSHHHRRSSVSTRRESAELMGVSLPDLPTVHSDDNINLGDKDSIRRRALWALEGKPDMAFSKVEIPDMSSPDMSKSFDFPTKPSFPPGSGLNGASTFAGKRDSFGKMFGSTSVSKDQLGTLVEEEEEEEEDSVTDPIKEHKETPQLVMQPPPKVHPRHRPASLNLRPLSLVQSNFVISGTGSLPTPGPSPDTRQLLGSITFDDAVSPNNSSPFSRRFSYSSDGASVDKKRRSSISYKRSTETTPRDMFLLPTPEMTPTEHRFPFSNDQDSNIQQPLSIAEQHFLFQSHHVLLSRITDLERTLRNRASRSRHLSIASDASLPSSDPSDEMFQLISDLKAERDELKRDVDGWRRRVADADKQASMLAKRVEAERREAWVARNHLSGLEVENSALESSLEIKASELSQSLAEIATLTRERNEMKDEIMKLNARLKDADAALDECARLRSALEHERACRKELEKLLDDAGLLNTPKPPHIVSGSRRRPPFLAKPVGMRPHGLGFQSVDSESSTTDVESLDGSFTKAEFTLDAVAEEEAEFSDEENGLAGYEDEEASDASFSSPCGSSISSADELDITSGTRAVDTPRRLVSPSLPAPSKHESRPSLSKTWTFPNGDTVACIKEDDDVDRFFGCLEDLGGSPPLFEEMNLDVFSSACRSMSEDELPPFVLPSDVGVVVETASSRSLDVVPEEEEEDAMFIEDVGLVGEAVEGGMRFTFNAPPIVCVTPPPDLCLTPPPEIRITPPVETCMTTPAVRPGAKDSVSSEPESAADDEDDSTNKIEPGPVTSPPRSSPPSRSNSRTDSPPSSIPRAISLRSISPQTPTITFTPSKNVSSRFTTPSTHSTPPSKRTSSSIPQPVTPPKFYSAPAKAQMLKLHQASSPNGSTFKPHSKVSMTNDPMSIIRCSSSQSGGATSKVNGASNPNSTSSICEYFYAQDTPSITSNPLAARSPFQKLSRLMTFSWAPGAATVASYIVPNNLGGPGAEGANSASSSSSIGSSATRSGRKFVSKARQLERLGSRLSFEKKNGTAPCSMVSACKGCSTDTVYL